MDDPRGWKFEQRLNFWTSLLGIAVVILGITFGWLNF